MDDRTAFWVAEIPHRGPVQVYECEWRDLRRRAFAADGRGGELPATLEEVEAILGMGLSAFHVADTREALREHLALDRTAHGREAALAMLDTYYDHDE